MTVAASSRKRCGRCARSVRKHFSKFADLGTVAASTAAANTAAAFGNLATRYELCIYQGDRP